jgi:hypothetical protein
MEQDKLTAVATKNGVELVSDTDRVTRFSSSATESLMQAAKDWLRHNGYSFYSIGPMELRAERDGLGNAKLVIWVKECRGGLLESVLGK